MYVFVQFMIMSALIGCMLFLKEKILYISGGSLTFEFIATMLMGISVIYKKNIRELTALITLFASIYLINLIYGMQVKVEFGHSLNFIIFEVIFCIITFFIFYSYWILINYFRPKDLKENRYFIGVMERFLLAPLAGMGYVFIASIMFSELTGDISRYIHVEYFIPTGIILMTLGFLTSFINVKRVTNIIPYFVNNAEQYRFSYKSYIFAIGTAIVFFVISYVMEMVRGCWSILILSYLLLAVILLNLWSIWKYKFIGSNEILQKTELKELESIYTSPKRLIAFIILFMSPMVLLFIIIDLIIK